jgi:hypothetical protein
MSKDRVVEDALLQWLKGATCLFDAAAGAAVADVASLEGAQTSRPLLCALKTVLLQDADADDADADNDESSLTGIYRAQGASGASASDLLAAVVGLLEQRYDQRFDGLSAASVAAAAAAGDALPFDVSQVRKIVELTLGWAMLFGHEQQKQQYVEYIISLKPDHQRALMLIIQEQQETANSGSGDDDDDNGHHGALGTPPKAASSDDWSPPASPLGFAPPLGTNRRQSASAFGHSGSPYKRLMASHSAKKSKPKEQQLKQLISAAAAAGGSGGGGGGFHQTPKSQQQLAASNESLRSQVRLMSAENLRLEGALADALQKLALREEERAQLTEGSDKRAVELKKVMAAEMQVGWLMGWLVG